MSIIKTPDAAVQIWAEALGDTLKNCLSHEQLLQVLTTLLERERKTPPGIRIIDIAELMAMESRVYRLLLTAREQGIIPWHHIVDETRSIERIATWDDPEDYARTVARSYHRDFWNQQPYRVQVWSEKGTVRGVLRPVLDHLAVGFNPVHGFNSGTSTYDVAQDDDGRQLIILYVGDFDPSGMFMSEVDLPKRFSKYGGHHIELQRIALLKAQLRGLPSFPASDKGPDKNGKSGDPRYKWFVSNYGRNCWELDAMDPNDLRDCVEQEIRPLIEPVAWARCEVVNAAEHESLRTVLAAWKG